MSYQNQKRHGGKPRQERRSLGMTIRFTNDEGKIDADLFDRTANRVAKIVANKGDRRASQINKSTQLRRFYDELVMWEEKVRQTPDKFDEYLPFIRMLKAKAAYAEGRKLVDGAFVDLIEQTIDFIKSAADLRTAKLFFEAFMGFYKLEKGD